MPINSLFEADFRKEDKMKFDNLGDRMKDYENISRIKLTKKMPVIIRIDGKAFHTFTRGFNKPFDKILMTAMQETCKYLCANVMNCKLAYTQSDEISLLLVDYENNDCQPWFDNNLQKLASVSASMATLAFNRVFNELVDGENKVRRELCKNNTGNYSRAEEVMERYLSKLNSALFDSRVFILPQHEVCNYFIWRQQDATRNSIESVGQSKFSTKELHGVNCNQIQDKLFVEKGVNWNDFSTPEKRGTCIVKEYYDKDGAKRSRWVADEDIPVFTQDRAYIDKFVFVG